MTYRVVHYINQFYGGIGGEDRADERPSSREGAVGPGGELQNRLGDRGTVVGTVICGDGYYGEHMDEARSTCLELIRAFSPDLFVAGPAFNAGRYGVACGDICAAVESELEIPAVTAMYEENPGVELYSPETFILPASDSARGMKDAMARMAALGLKRAGK